MYFVIRHCRLLEESYLNRIADFVYLWLFGAVVLTAINCAVYLLTDTADWLPAPLMFLGPSLAAIIVYVWARRNPHLRMSFLGLFEFDAPYLPWVMMGFGLLLGNSPYNDLLGIIVGHLYYFLADVYPAQTVVSRSKRLTGCSDCAARRHNRRRASPPSDLLLLLLLRHNKMHDEINLVAMTTNARTMAMA
jgi:hypothetical protein